MAGVAGIDSSFCRDDALTVKRLWRLLLSRRLAMGLIVGFVVYAVLATTLSHGNWGAPYGSPLFLTLIALLVVNTAACAWQRTQRAWRITRSTRGLSDAALLRLAGQPEFEVLVESGSDDAALVAAADALSQAGFRVSRYSRAIDGSAGLANVWASPVFHWALIALALVVMLGRATRAEGFIGLPVGERIADIHGSYLEVDEGALFAERHSGVEFEATRVDRNHVEGGVEYGPTPFVTAYRDGVAVTSGWIRPNRPLRTGSLMVHMAALGPAVTLAVEASGGVQPARETLMLERSQSTSSGTAPQESIVSGLQGAEPVRIRVQVVVKRAASGAATSTVSRAIIETAPVGAAAFGPPFELAEGESVDLAGGQRLRVVDVKDWVRVSVANDWSVPFIYTLLVIAILALAVAVLLSTRRVSLLLVENEDGGCSLNGRTWHSGRSPLFSDQIADMVRASVGTEEVT